MNRGLRHLFLLGVIFLGLIAIVSIIKDDDGNIEDLNAKQFMEALQDGDIDEMVMQPKNKVYLITGTLKADDKPFVARIPDIPDITKSIYELREEQGVLETAVEEQPSAFLNFLMMMLPFIIIGIIFFLILTRAQGGGGGGGRIMNFGKSKAKMYTEDEQKVRFKRSEERRVGNECIAGCSRYE